MKETALQTIVADQLSTADLHVDAIYQGGRNGNAGDDPFPRLLGMSNQGGFRYRGDIAGRLEMLLLTSSFSDPDWPDAIDREIGVFTYYGDNKSPGRGLHDTGVATGCCSASFRRRMVASRDGCRCRPPFYSPARGGGAT